jgi:hypothetical protein
MWGASFAAVEQRLAMVPGLLGLLAFLRFEDIFPTQFERLTEEGKLGTAASEEPDRHWQSYFSPDAPPKQYAIQAAFGVLQTTHWSSGEMTRADT